MRIYAYDNQIIVLTSIFINMLLSMMMLSLPAEESFKGTLVSVQ